MVAIRGGDAAPFDDAAPLRAGNEVIYAISRDRAAAARSWLTEQGLEPADAAASNENLALSEPALGVWGERSFASTMNGEGRGRIRVGG
jgi:hypothetical protein